MASRQLIGMVHALPLPGSPSYLPPTGAIVERAVEDAILLEESGFDALLVENYGDAPFFADRVPPITVASLARVVAAVRAAVDVPVGVNVLRNDAIAALSIAAACDARFIRVNVLSSMMYTDQGPIVGQAARVSRLRASLNPEIEVLADHFEGKQLHQPNDLTIDGQGRIYFTDRPGANVTPEQTGVHGVYRIDPDGSIARILTEPEIERPNGIVISPDDATLYLIETAQQEGGARMIRAYDLAADGTASNMRVFHDFYPGRSGDGMTIDSEGNLYVAAGLNRLRGTSETLDTVTGVHVFSPDGELLEHIPIWEDTITNVAFGGDDLRTLYITAGKTLFSVRTDVTGTRR